MAIAKPEDQSFNKLYLKATSFCAYQERTQQEVREKLYGDITDKDVIEEVIVKLIQENFLNEERFAKSYAGGKYRMKKWGRIRIEHELKMRGLSAYCIRKGLEEIEQSDYENTIVELLNKKNQEEKEKNQFKRKSKIASYMIRKGYEPELVWQKLNELLE